MSGAGDIGLDRNSERDIKRYQLLEHIAERHGSMREAMYAVEHHSVLLILWSGDGNSQKCLKFALQKMKHDESIKVPARTARISG
jgi:hypothetical protein